MTGNWLDRTIGWVSPTRGARRLQARRAMSVLGYDGARSGRRTDGWVTASTSADAESVSAMGALRDRARDLARNNPYAARAIDVKVANTIGTGILAEIPNRTLASRWEVFAQTCDASGRLDLYGLQALIERCRMESGECLIQFVNTPMVTGGVAFQLRVLEPDHLDDSRDGRAPTGDNQIRHGVEYDSVGRVVAYWILPEHPGNSWATNYTRGGKSVSNRIPADDIIHVYRKLRPGQSRGVSDFAPVMLRMRDLDDYDDAEGMRKKIEACLAAFVTSSSSVDASMMGTVSTDDTGRIETLYPGMVEYLRPGESVTMADPKASGGYADYQRFGLRAIAAGLGIPYELMTGDLSQVNYSSYRAGLVDFRRRVEQDQWQIYVQQVCGRIWQRFVIEASVASQANIGARTVPKWTPPRFELIDPLKETLADIESCQAGFDSWDEIVRKRGWTSGEQLDAIEKWQKELDRRGITLTSDARTKIAAKASPAADKPAPDDDAPQPDDDEKQAAKAA